MNQESYQFVDPKERSHLVEGSFHAFEEQVREFVENHPQSPRLYQCISEISQIGIWRFLNQMHLDPAKPLVFTGQQPTIDYGIYRRFGKRAGIHTEFTLIHTHADHDQAGKNGFGTISLPVHANGRVDYKSYSLAQGFEADEIMSKVPKPDLQTTLNFFRDIEKDAKNFDPRNANVANWVECQRFIQRHYDLIRSSAELNAAIQTFLIRKLSPQTRTIDFMLTDLFGTQIFKESMAQLLLQMPEWINAYNSAINHVRNTSYKESTHLPQVLHEEFDNRGGKYNELPLWILKKNRNGVEARSRAWMYQINGQTQIGAVDDEAKSLENILTFDHRSTIKDILCSPKFEMISPAAVTLVDILRVRLGLPVIHGKTGHLYDAINELTCAILEGESIPEGLLVHPRPKARISSMTAISHNPRLKGREAVVRSKHIDSLKREAAATQTEIENLNKESAIAFQQTNDLLNEAFLKLRVDPKQNIQKIPVGHILFGISQELDSVFSKDFWIKSSQDFSSLGMFVASEKLNNTKFLKNAVEQLFIISTETGEDLLRTLFETHNLERIKHLWSVLTEWVRSKNRQRQLLGAKKILIGRLKSQQEEIEKLSEVPDLSLIKASIYNPRALEALHRLERSHNSR